MRLRHAIGLGLIAITIPIGLYAYAAMICMCGIVHANPFCISIPIITLFAGLPLFLSRNDRIPEPSGMVIVSVLLLVLVLTIALFNYQGPDQEYRGNTPQASITATRPDGNYSLEIVEIDQPTRFREIQFDLIDQDGELVLTGRMGALPSKLNETNFIAVENYDDEERYDTRLSQGDRILITSSEQGGPAESGYYFRLSFFRSEMTIVQVELT